MSRWTHNICTDCWEETQDVVVPTRVIEADKEICCWCNKETTSGIYLRHDPDDPVLKCKGTHVSD